MPVTPSGVILNGTPAIMGVGATPAVSRPLYARSPAVTSAGFGGNNVTFFVATVAARITAFLPATGPCTLFFETGANDENGLVADGPLYPTYVNAMTSVLNQVIAYNPAVQICVISCLTFNDEAWQAGPVWRTPANKLLPSLQTICASYSNVVCADVNTPALAWVSTFRPINAGAPYPWITSDGTHPVDLGKVLYGSWIMPYLRFST
jgi:hypothetical protein